MKVLFFSTRAYILKDDFVKQENRNYYVLNRDLSDYTVLGVPEKTEVAVSDSERKEIMEEYFQKIMSHLEESECTYFFLHDKDFGGPDYLDRETSYYEKIGYGTWIVMPSGIEKFMLSDNANLKEKIRIVFFQHEQGELPYDYLFDTKKSDESTAELIKKIEKKYVECL